MHHEGHPMHRLTLRAALFIAGLAALPLALAGPLSAGKNPAGQEKAVKGEGGKGGVAKAVEIPPRQGKSEVIRLFDGKDLEGWEGNMELWSVQDVPAADMPPKGSKRIPTVKAIVGKNTKEVPVSTYLLTKRKFTDFRLTATVKLKKWKSDMHSGIAFWGRKASEKGDAHTYAGHLVMFPTGGGMFDLFGRGGLPVSGEPAKKAAGSGTGTSWRSWPRATGCASRSTASWWWTGATPSPSASSKARSGCSCTPTSSRRRCSSAT